MKIKLSESKCNELIRQAFKKLKASTFFDKTQLILRDKLIAYETSPDFEKNLSNLATKVMFYDWDEIVDSINVLSFPKKIVRDNGKESGEKQFITNVVNKATSVDDIQCFLDMDVEGYILGVAWLLTIGCFALDRDSGRKSQAPSAVFALGQRRFACSFGEKIRHDDHCTVAEEPSDVTADA